MRLARLAAFGGLLVPLLAWAYVGTYSRYTADDYSWPVRLSQTPFLDLQLQTYQTAFGRFASTLAICLAALADSPITPFLPAAVLAAWVGALAWLGWEAFPLLGVDRCLSPVAAILLVLAILGSAPDPYQVLYWQVGMLTYLPPLVVLPASAATLLFGYRRGWPMLALMSLAFLAALVAGGFSEPYMALQVAGLSAALFAARRSPTARAILTAALAGAILSAAIVALSPGNALRHAEYPSRSAVEIAIILAAYTGALLLRVLLAPSTIASLLVAAALGHASKGWAVRMPSFIRFAEVALAVTMVGLLPGVYGAAGSQPLRALFIPSAALASVLLAWAFAAGYRLRALALPRALPLVAVAALSVVATVQALTPLPAFQRYAGAWEQRDRLARSSDAPAALPPVPNPFGLHDIGADPSHWANVYIHRYYSLHR